MANELREIIEYVYSCDVRSDTLDKKNIIDQSIAKIKSLFKSKLPEKKYIDPYKLSHLRNQGFNSCLTEIEKIVEEL